MNVSLASKFRGCLIGSLVGDCLGAPFEGELTVSKTVLSSYFTKLLECNEGTKSAHIYSYTDDTAMTLCVAKSLVEKKRFEPENIAKKFAEEYYASPDRRYGRSVINLFKVFKDESYEDIFLPAKQQFSGLGSYGNGGAMRIAPIALYAFKENEDMLMQMAKESALITHSHPNGYAGAILQCLAVHQALKSYDSINPVQFISTLLKAMENIESSSESISVNKGAKPLCESLTRMQKVFLNQEDISIDKIPEYFGNDVAAHKSVPTAIYAFLRCLQPINIFESDNPFIRTVFLSIAVGGDTDTISSMSCSIAGAYHGIEMIPQNVRTSCEGHEICIDLADKIFNMAV